MSPRIGPSFEFDRRSKFMLDLDDACVKEAQQAFGALGTIFEMKSDLNVVITRVGPYFVMHA